MALFRPRLAVLHSRAAVRCRLLAPASLVLLGCRDQAPAWRGHVQDSAGVAVVENPSEPVLEEAPAIREVLRIGTADGDPVTQFGLIASVAVSASGSVYVLDQQNRRVRVFDPMGEFVREVGRSGAGPGELSDFAVAAMLADGDTIIVADPGNRRFTVFGPEGRFVDDFPMPFPHGTLPQRFALLPDGAILEMARTEATPDRPELRDDVFVRVERSGSILDTIHRMPTSRSIRYEGDLMRFTAYVPEPHWAMDRDGRFYSAMSGSYRIEVRDSRGKLLSIITREHDPAPITDEDRRAFLDMLRRTLAERRTDPMLIEQMVEGMVFADHYPVFASFQPGPDGTLWVQRIRTAVDAAREGIDFEATDVGDNEFDVFDREGRFMAVARLPERFVPLTYLGDRLYGMWRDELDVQHIMAVEVVWAPVEFPGGVPRSGFAHERPPRRR